METLDLVRVGADGTPHWTRVWPTPQDNPRHAGLELWMAAYGYQIVSRPAGDFDWCSAKARTGTNWRPGPPSCGSSPARERQHPGAQLTLFEVADGWRYSLWATSRPTTTKGWLSQNALHRRCPPGPRPRRGRRTSKHAGLGHFPPFAS